MKDELAPQRTVQTDSMLPSWTRRVFTDTSGRDPLGLTRVSSHITDYLLTGIITTTNRARYYSFYCWALWHTLAEDHPRRYQDLVEGFRRREAMLALSSLSCNPDTSVVGRFAAQAHLQKAASSGIVNCDFRVLPSNALGGYGQYYKGSMFELGLITPSADGIDRVSEERGAPLAKSFHSVVMGTAYVRDKLYTKTAIPIDGLESSKARMSLDSLTASYALEERTLLMNLLFGLNEQEPTQRTVMRRLTLAQILYVISQYEENGFAPAGTDPDWYLVYPPYYYGLLWPEETTVLKYDCPEVFTECRSTWRQFCLQQFITHGLESLMYGILEAVGGESTGLTLSQAVSVLTQPAFVDALESTVGKPCKRPRDLLFGLGIGGIPDEESSLESQELITLLDKRSEVQISRLGLGSPAAAAARGVLMLAVLYCKWRGIRHDAAFQYVAGNAGRELWAGLVLPSLDVWLSADTRWEDALSSLSQAFVIDQHDRIMYEKGRLESHWLHCLDGRVYKDEDYGPRWRSSRHDNAVSILCDIGLLQASGADTIHITPAGKSILREMVGQV